MIQKITLICAMFFSAFLYAQERIYIDLYGNPVSQDQAKFYREITEKDDIYHIKDFYLDGQLQMEAYSHTLEIESITDFIGKYTFYHPNGKIEITGEVQDGKNVNKRFGYDDKGRLVYQEDFLGDTSQSKYITYPSDDFPYNEIRWYNADGSSKTVTYDKNINKIRYEIIIKDIDAPSQIYYYDRDGKLIGTSTYTDNYEIVGTEVSYYSNPMNVEEIIQRNDQGEVTLREKYFPNGKLFSKYKTDKKVTEIFYNEKGKKLGELIYQTEDEETTPYEGTEYEIDEKGNLTVKREYKLGNILSATNYYKNKKEKSRLEYDLDQYPNKITFYTPKGQIKSTLTYQDGAPYQGIYYADLETNDAYTSYREGTLIEQKNYDDKKTLRYAKTLLEEGDYACQIYDDKGQRIYEYTIDDRQNIKIFQLENNKTIRAATIKGGIVTEGSLSYQSRNSEENTTVIVERQEGWFVAKIMKDNELIKETRINVKYLDSQYDYTYYIDESMLSEYSYMRGDDIFY